MLDLEPLNNRLRRRNLEARQRDDGKIVIWRLREPVVELRALGRHDTTEAAERATTGVHP